MNPNTISMTPMHWAKLLAWFGSLPWRPFEETDWYGWAGCETKEPFIVEMDASLSSLEDHHGLWKLASLLGLGADEESITAIREMYDDGTVSYNLYFTTEQAFQEFVFLNVHLGDKVGYEDYPSAHQLLDFTKLDEQEFILWLEDHCPVNGFRFPKRCGICGGIEPDHHDACAAAVEQTQVWDCAELPAPLR